MKRVTRFSHIAAVVGSAILAAGLGTPARAQADPDDAQRAVARISVMEGQVSVRRGDSGDWVAGVVNAPLMAGDNIATGSNSRAEIQFDAGNALRLGGDAQVNLADLQYNRYQIQLAQGTVTYRVLRPQSVDVEVDTPSVSVRPSKEGSYRISVNSNGETEVIARGGSVEVFSPKGSEWVNSGQMLMARGPATDPEFQLGAAPTLDAWDSWNNSRDRLELSASSNQYVPQGVYGAEDLDNYGNWVNVPDYGYVWHPVVAADWAPYGYGRWAWEDWYGWTWISYDPWGWAPYHYGRWFNRAGLGWCWYPGVLGVRHYWSPALVGFFGWGGGGIGVGFGYGNIGWVPLAPYEVFHPWWGRGYYGRGGYFNNRINITNVNVTNIYRNANFSNGIHGMKVGDFENGRFHDIGRYNGSQIGHVGAVQGAMPLSPGNAHLRFSDREVTRIPRTTATNTRFYSRQPAARTVERIPFAQQQRAFTQGGPANRMQGGGAGQAAPRAMDRPMSSGPNRVAGQVNQGNGPGPQMNDRPGRGAAGWQRFGAPGNGVQQGSQQRVQPGPGNAAGPRVQTAPQTPGWNRFGSPGQGAGTNNASPRYNAPEQQRSNGPAQRYNAPQDRPAAPNYSAPPANAAPRYNAPQSRPSAPSYGAPPANSSPRYNAPQSRPSAPSYSAPPASAAPRYNAPQSRPSAPSYSAPRYSAPPASAAPRYSAPPMRSAPSYSPPRNSGGGGFSAPRSGGGGGFSAPRSSGGGGFSAPRSSGGGGARSSGGGGNRGGGRR